MANRNMEPQPPAAAPPLLSAQSRGYVSTACQACKARRSKCSGNQPCVKCVEDKSACEYDASSDKRRRASKRKLEELVHDSNVLDELVAHLQSGEAIDAPGEESAVSLIRSGASKADLGLWLQRRRKEHANSKIKRLMSVDRLTDRAPISVPAHPWTGITDDDFIASHLVSLCFTWPESTWAHMIDHDCFIRDMRSGDRESPCCSPLLANLVMAHGCLYSDAPWARTDPTNPRTKGLHFLKEAERLWHSEEPRPSPQSLQALTSFCILYSAIGQDQTADQLLESFLSWPNDVVRMKVPDGVDSAEFEHSRRLAVWGAFHFQTAKSLIYKGSAQTRIRIPAIAQPYQDHPRDWSEEWTPYPYDRPPVAIARGLLETAKSEIHIIGADFYNSLVYRAENAVELDVDLTTERLLRRLDDFYYGLPGEWRWDVESPPAAHAMPFDIWLMYNWLRITLFQHQPSSTGRTAAIEQPEGSPRIKAELIRGARSIAEMMGLWTDTYGTLRFPIYMPYSCAVACGALLPYLDEAPVAASFHAMLTTITAGGETFPICVPLSRMLALRALERSVALPPEMMDGIRAVVATSWTEKEVAQFQDTMFPLLDGAHGDESELMRDFPKRTGDLSLDEPAPGPSSGATAPP